MCRLFGLLGNPSTPADPWLVSTHRSLLNQSNVAPEIAQPDGWGVAWYSDTRLPTVEKGVHGAFEEADRFRLAARNAKGPVVLGHLRLASNPMDLPRDRLIGLENSQPFTSGSYLFAHNGSITLPREMRPLLGKYESSVRGVNDSEILFWLLVKHTEELGDPVKAYVESVRLIQRRWEELGRPTETPFTGLNVLFTRGPNELYAFCLWRGEHGTGLMAKDRPYYALAYAADAKQCVVGSEPFDSREGNWTSLSNGEYLVARASSGLITVETHPLPLAGSAPLALASVH